MKTITLEISTDEEGLSLSVRVRGGSGAWTEATDSGSRAFLEYAERQVAATEGLEFREWLVAAVLDRLSGDALHVRSE